jgi:hypothetical protein
LTAPYSAPLTLRHFAAAFHNAATIYNQPLTAETAGLMFAVLTKAAPGMTQDLFDWGLQQALCSCRFMPRIVDILEACYERDTSGLPALPDIDPRFADSYLLGVYHRGEQFHHTALASAPVDTSRPKAACRHLQALPLGADAYLEDGTPLHLGPPIDEKGTRVGTDPRNWLQRSLGGRMEPPVDPSKPPLPQPCMADRFGPGFRPVAAQGRGNAPELVGDFIARATGDA